MGELLLHVELVPQRVLQLFTHSLSTPNPPENGVLRQSPKIFTPTYVFISARGYK
jgi:hypothetical protein